MEREPLIPIPREELEGMIGRRIHLRGMGFGCNWILEGIEGEMMALRTPKTRRPYRSHVSNALFTRRQAELRQLAGLN